MNSKHGSELADAPHRVAHLCVGRDGHGDVPDETVALSDLEDDDLGDYDALWWHRERPLDRSARTRSSRRTPMSPGFWSGRSTTTTRSSRASTRSGRSRHRPATR